MCNIRFCTNLQKVDFDTFIKRFLYFKIYYQSKGPFGCLRLIVCKWIYTLGDPLTRIEGVAIRSGGLYKLKFLFVFWDVIR